MIDKLPAQSFSQINEISNLINAFQLLLTPMIAIITCYIAWQQWQTNNRKLKLDLYDRRLKIYRIIQSHIAKVVQTTKPDIHEIYEFYNQTMEVDFLFPKEFRKFVDEVYSISTKLFSANQQYRDATMVIPEGYDHNAVCDMMNASLAWFLDKHSNVKKMFEPYLSIKK